MSEISGRRGEQATGGKTQGGRGEGVLKGALAQLSPRAPRLLWGGETEGRVSQRGWDVVEDMSTEKVRSLRTGHTIKKKKQPR